MFTDWWQRPLAMHSTRGLGWFRIFGFGLHWKDTRIHPLLFSERYSGRGWQIGHWRLRFLTPP